MLEEKIEKMKAVHAKHLQETKAPRQAKREEQTAAAKRKRVRRMMVCFHITGCDCVRGRVSWMFHITSCVVQAAADKAKKVSDEKQKDLDQAQKDEEKKNDDSKTDSKDDDEPMADVAKKKKETDARDARKQKQIEEADVRLKRGQALVESASNSVHVVAPEKHDASSRS